VKRLYAITLLALHLFYIGGYTLLFQYYIGKADHQMVRQVFSDKIDDAKLIEIKIPVNFPALTDWDSYELVSGEIQLKKAYYNYVKLKVTRDTLYFVCLPNPTKTRLVNANMITVKEVSDVPVSKNSHSPVVKKMSVLSEYNLQAFRYSYSSFGIFIKANKFSVHFSLNNPFIESPGKPPNFIS
jgi:hypothetical protein